MAKKHLKNEWQKTFGEKRAAIDRAILEEAERNIVVALNLSECDCCVRYRTNCRNVRIGGMDVHACPECLGDDEGDYD